MNARFIVFEPAAANSNYPISELTRVFKPITAQKITKQIYQIYQKLYNHYGPQFWWPGESPLEVVVGAVLTQNTAWHNVEKAISNIKAKKNLSIKQLTCLPVAELAQLIKPSGFYHIKAQRLHNLLSFLTKNYPSSLAKMNNIPTERLRTDLLSVKGVGEETADSILLYAFAKPVFVVDAYTKRIFSRHKFFPYDTDYSAIQKLFTDNLPKRIKIYNEYHALIVRLAKEYCKKIPNCSNCPLSDWSKRV
jgi:endonuclease III related protein